MVYLKSILAGLGAAAVVAVGIGLYVQGVQYRVAMSASDGDSNYVDVRWHKGPVVGTLMLVFAAGFWWQYRRERS